jgi:uncharacterized protein (TIGR02271 family)
MMGHGRADRSSVVGHEQEADVGVGTTDAGSVMLRKNVDTEAVEHVVPVGVEHANIERTAPTDEDSGQIEHFTDGTISVPVFEEEIVVTKRLRVRERILIRTTIETHDEVLRDEVRRERVEVLATGNADVVDDA